MEKNLIRLVRFLRDDSAYITATFVGVASDIGRAHEFAAVDAKPARPENNLPIRKITYRTR